MSAATDIARLVERQMRNWSMAREQPTVRPAEETEPEVADFVAISRSVGSGGAQLAHNLGERLRWPVFDREILQYMAGDDGIRARMYENMDERDAGWVLNSLRWILESDFRRDDYFHRLTEAILVLARQGPAIFLGRGADLVLPRDRGLRVRVEAPLELRVRAYAERTGTDEATARATVERVDQEREEFIRRHFRRVPDDRLRFDLVLNLERFSLADAVDLIVAYLRRRGVVQ